MTPHIVISIKGGVVQDVFSTAKDSRVTVVDWDQEGQSPDDTSIVEMTDYFGKKVLVHVSDFPVVALKDHNNSDVAKALELYPNLRGL